MAMHDPTRSPRFTGLEFTLREALSLGRNYADVEPILLGLGCEEEDVPLDSDSDVAALAADASLGDLGALSDCRLKGLIGRLKQREVIVSYERRILHARIDLLRAEQVARLRQRYAADSSSW